jgi:predicted transcriptional regulator of viral defense system
MRTSPPTRVLTQKFLSTHPTFTKAEFVSYLGPGRTRDAQLEYHTRTGRIRRIRRGLYLSQFFGTSSLQAPDPYLIASKVASDAVIAYHSALSFFGRAHSRRTLVTFITAEASRPFAFSGWSFRAVRFPKALRSEKERLYGVRAEDRQGLPVRVASLERTLVDSLDRPDLCGGWEEVWRSLESVEYFNLDAVSEYALSLRNATVAAKVGFYLEQHRESLRVEDRHLDRLRRRRPRGRHYLVRGKPGDGRLVSGWNLIVPKAILERF